MMLLLTRTTIALLVLTVTQMAAGMLLLRDLPEAPGAFGWWLLSNLLTATFIVQLARHLGGPRAVRIGVMFAVLFGIPANYLAELFLFDLGITPATLARIYASQLLSSAVVATVVGWWPGAGLDRPAPYARSGPAWAWRIVLGVLAYEVAYFTAGLAVYPFVADAYAGRPLPTLDKIALLQMGRGLGFVGVVLALARVFRGTRTQIAVAAGLTLSIVGGIAPLIVPSTVLSDALRHAHLIEVGISNFLFGAFVGWLLAESEDPRTAEEPGAAGATLAVPH